ncbi:hypothetical protein [Mycobacterium canetti]|uniref:hypothetical protein n=1 Tax=Mycobacterium canetti TaxID=78331 RepID=UPI0002DAC323|nr:hypothetical protein [Mycobacterium canetti]
MGLSGRVPHRVEAATKTALLDLLDHAVEEGWTLRRACHQLELGEVRPPRLLPSPHMGVPVECAPGSFPGGQTLPTIAQAGPLAAQTVPGLGGLQTQLDLDLRHHALLEAVERRADGLVGIDTDDEARPILLAVSDNGPQMTSGSTREFMAMCAIDQHFGRPVPAAPCK